MKIVVALQARIREHIGKVRAIIEDEHLSHEQKAELIDVYLHMIESCLDSLGTYDPSGDVVRDSDSRRVRVTHDYHEMGF